MKTLFTFFLALTIAGTSLAQIPTGYYAGTDGLTGYDLKTKLSTITTDGSQDLGYGGLWVTYATSDVDKYYENNGTVLDMYSENPAGPDAYEYKLGQFSAGGNQCSTVDFTAEGYCYNREHSLPKSFFGNAPPMANDAHFIIPTDYFVNQQRSNYPYGETDSPNWTSKNGSKVGGCSFPGYYGISAFLQNHL